MTIKSKRLSKIPVSWIEDSLEVVGNEVFWKKDRPPSHFKTEVGYKIWKAKHAGKIFGSEILSSGNNYRHGGFTYEGTEVKILAHVAAFILYYGRYPQDNLEIDHIDGVGTNNSKENLREVTKQENMQNKVQYSTNTSGHTGVSWHKATSKWSVQGGSKYLGIYTTLEQAVAKRVEWELTQDKMSIRHGKAV